MQGSLPSYRQLQRCASTGILAPGSGVSYGFTQLGGLSISGAPSGVQVNLLPAQLQARLFSSSPMPARSSTATVSFNIAGGPVVSGSISALNLVLAGVTLQSPVAATLSNSGLDATGVTAVGPSTFGSKSQAITAALHIASSGVTLGTAVRALASPSYGGAPAASSADVIKLCSRTDASGYYWT